MSSFAHIILFLEKILLSHLWIHIFKICQNFSALVVISLIQNVKLVIIYFTISSLNRKEVSFEFCIEIYKNLRFVIFRPGKRVKKEWDPKKLLNIFSNQNYIYCNLNPYSKSFFVHRMVLFLGFFQFCGTFQS